ncbi:hypothetical protein MRX96_052908 [Rhipicephalus microplus]
MSLWPQCYVRHGARCFSGVVYDQSWSSEEAKQLSQALDRANINASDVGEDLPQHGESGGTQARPRTPHLSLAGVRLEPEDIFRSSKKGEKSHKLRRGPT